MRIIVQLSNEYALEEYIFDSVTNMSREYYREIRLPADRFCLKSDLLILLNISQKGLYLDENKSNAYFFSINKSETYEEYISKETAVKVVTRDTEELNMWIFFISQPLLSLYSVEGSRVISIGKGLNNDIALVDFAYISNNHLIIEKHNKGVVIRVKGKEGCFLNGKYIGYMKSECIQYGDAIKIYGITFLWLDDCIGVQENFGNCKEDSRLCLVRLEPVTEMKEVISDSEPMEAEFSPSPRNVHVEDLETVELDGPPAVQKIRKAPLLLTVGPAITMAIPMGLGCGIYIIASQRSGSNSGMYMYTGLITALASAVLGSMWAIINVKQARKAEKENENQRKREYAKYINRYKRILEDKYRYNRNVLLRNAPSVREIMNSCNYSLLWNRRADDTDCYNYRLGLGKESFKVEIKVPKEKFTMYPDELADFPTIIKDRYRYINDVPVCTNILENRIQGFISHDSDSIRQMFINIVLQIATITSPVDARLVIMFKNNMVARRDVEIFKWLPHSWGEEEHYVCCDSDRFGELQCRMEALIANPDFMKKRMILITDAWQSFSKEIFTNEKVSVLIFAERYAGLPPSCNVIVQKDPEYEGIIDVARNNLRREILFEHIGMKDAFNYVRTIAGIRLRMDALQSPIPRKVTIPELFEVDRITEEMIEDNWKKNDTYNSLRTPIGMSEDRRIVYLDTHEKAHGPHGLVAGMTGSGKSEMLQTFIISLAIRYSPEEVGFFLIDYKGGGMANLFERLPHVLGAISNLSGNIIYRAMVSVRSENERRQKLFASANVNSIRDYQKLFRAGEVAEPLPHIFIIIDEFAELKREEPDFMKELISVAQVGRSLGVHLILATQKPAGTVDDNIFSNSRFRICLRVQDKQDSNDMLHNTDAAYISNPGRAFLQVGNDELYEQFQAGFTMELYEEKTDHDKKVLIVDEYGRRHEPFGNNKLSRDIRQTHFSVILDMLDRCADKLRKRNDSTLWLPPLEDKIILKSCMEGNKKYEITIGKYDEPKNQYQGDFSINLIKSGHHVICGNAASGKSTFLQSYIYTYLKQENPKTLNIYIIDYSNNLLSCFKASDMVGCYITEETQNRVGNLFCMISEIVKKRKKEWDGIGFEQRLMAGVSTDPAILLVIDNYGSFREKTACKYDQEIIELLKFGETYGIFILMSGSAIGSNDIPSRVFENCKTGICLRMNDKYQYSECMRTIRIPIYPDENYKGRGLAKINGEILEFQTGLTHTGNDYERLTSIREDIEILNTKYGSNVARRVPYIPDEPNLAEFANYITAENISDCYIPLGYDTISAKPVCIDTREIKCFVIAGKKRSGKSNCMRILKYFASVYDRSICEVSSAEELLSRLNETDDNYLFIENVENLIDSFYSDNYSKSIEEKLCSYIGEGGHLFMTFSTEGYTKIVGRALFEKIKEVTCGIYLGGGLDRQNIFDFSYLPYSEQCATKAMGIGTLLRSKEIGKGGDIVIPKF